MFYLYESTPTESGFYYAKIQEISLFGCNNGLIARALSLSVSPETNGPLQWHLCARHLLQAAGLPGNEIVLNAAPKNEEAVWMYRLRDVYGHSESDWTLALRWNHGWGEPGSPIERCVRGDTKAGR